MKKFLCYFLGIIFLLAGISSFSTNVLSALIGLIIGILLLYVGRKHSKKKDAPIKTSSVTNNSITPIVNNTVSVSNADAPAKTEKHHVAGVTHYMDNIMELAEENPDYDMSKKEIVDACMDGQRIYQYYYHADKVELVPESTNEYDPNAIKVILDEVHVGYIKKGSCAHIKKLLSNGSIKSITADLVGGRYKAVYENDEDDGRYELVKDSNEYGIILEITLN